MKESTNIAEFIGMTSHIDPNSKGDVEMQVYLHPCGGMFAIDALFLDAEKIENVPDLFDTESEGVVTLNDNSIYTTPIINRIGIINQLIKDAQESGDFTLIEEALSKLPNCHLKNADVYSD